MDWRVRFKGRQVMSHWQTFGSVDPTLTIWDRLLARKPYITYDFIIMLTATNECIHGYKLAEGAFW